MAIKRLMRQTRTILLLPLIDINGVLQIVGGTQASPTLTPFATPTSALLNQFIPIVAPGAGLASIGGNVSGATLDNVSLGLAPSATDSTLLITSVGNEVDPTMKKVNSTLEFMRDQSQTDAGTYNLAWQLARAADIRYAIADRVQGNKFSTSLAAVGDVWSLYSVATNDGVDNIGDQKFTTFTQNFIADGVVNPQFSLTA